MKTMASVIAAIIIVSLNMYAVSFWGYYGRDNYSIYYLYSIALFPLLILFLGLRYSLFSFVLTVPYVVGVWWYATSHSLNLTSVGAAIILVCGFLAAFVALLIKRTRQ